MRAQQSILIDERGKLWDATSWQLRKSLYLNGVEGDVSAPLINNLGFVGVTSRGNSAIIRFNPKSVSKAAISALYYWLSSRSCMRLGLTFALNGEGQRYEIFGSPRAALLRIEALLDQEQLLAGGRCMRPEQANFLRFPGAPRWGCCSSFGGTPPAPSWTASICHCSSSSPRTATSYSSRGRRGASTSPAPAAGCIFRTSLLVAHSAAPASIADKDYAQWAAHFYSTVVESQQPRYDHLRAYINWPRTGRVERKYSRMILPCRAPCGRKLLLGVSGPLAEKRLLADPL